MIPNKEITSEHQPIYDIDKARKLYSEGRDYIELSIMMHQNIQWGTQNDNISLARLQYNIVQLFGYCFKADYDPYCNKKSCNKCDIYKKIKKRCWKLKSKIKMRQIRANLTKKEFGIQHKQWCQEVGIPLND